MPREVSETILPLLEERISIAKRRTETAHVSIAVTTLAQSRAVEAVLQHRAVDVERVPIGRQVEAAPQLREEDGVLIIPVLEEVLVVERRLMLREEIRLRFRTEDRRESLSVEYLTQSAEVSRLTPDAPAQPRTIASVPQESIMNRTITGLFDSRPEAERAVEHLVQKLGVDRTAVQIHAAGTENAASTTTTRTEEPGFFSSLANLFLPDEDRTSYSEGIRRGGIVVSASVDESKLDDAMEAFERNGAVDLDEREVTWRKEGWTAASGDAVLQPTAATARPAMATGTAPRAMGAADSEERITLMEEQLRVGKREVGGGRVRVRSYIVETPVHEQVTLREENVTIERRPVDRALTDADMASFRDRTIEAVETREEAVVSKEARVKEELVIRKTAEERVETVSDTIRHTEVEVEDERVRSETSSMAGAASTTRPVQTPKR